MRVRACFRFHRALSPFTPDSPSRLQVCIVPRPSDLLPLPQFSRALAALTLAYAHATDTRAPHAPAPRPTHAFRPSDVESVCCEQLGAVAAAEGPAPAGAQHAAAAMLIVLAARDLWPPRAPESDGEERAREDRVVILLSLLLGVPEQPSWRPRK
jgi:hypothetical protein